MDISHQLRLQHQPAALLHLLQHCSENQLHAHPFAGKWSILDNLAHLGRYQQIFQSRMEAIVGGQQPAFDPYKAENDPAFTAWQQKTPDELLQDLQSERIDLNHFLASLTPEQLACRGSHPVYGNLQAEEWIEFFLLHEAHHLFTIFKLAAALRTGAAGS